MNEQDQMDQLLSRAMSAPVPTLSPQFDRRLAARLAPRRLSAQGRAGLVVYSVVALFLSVWVMRQTSIDWSLVLASIVVPLIIVTMLVRRFVRPNPPVVQAARN